jgi:calcineurin-like phosphoesterase family protein
MSDIYFISDTHFSHANILTFKREDGTPLRAFKDVQEMDETIIANWNSVVRPQDKIYHLGDICMNKRSLSLLSRLNGHKRLVRGNHDAETAKLYLEYFDDVYGVRVFAKEKFICSHIPIHPASLSRWKLNVHGHLHSNIVRLPDSSPDKRYMNVSVEQINYTPISMDTILEYIERM